MFTYFEIFTYLEIYNCTLSMNAEISVFIKLAMPSRSVVTR